jgi:threonine dehydrogenase-like Zn-dependent dehydrogenase
MSGSPAVVETTASPEAIAAALERVADGGRVIVVGPVTDIPAFPTYDELHVRGLELVVRPD